MMGAIGTAHKDPLPRRAPVRLGVARLVLLVTRLDRPLQLAASMLTIDTSEVCNPPRGIVGYSVLCAAWRFFIISNHSIEPGWGKD